MNMEMWTNLGIEKTKDIDAITEAYHEKLKLVHPEEKPEEFMALRAEYEEAMKYAQQSEEGEEKEKTPIDLWIERVEEVYGDIPRRLDAGEWQALLKDDVCQSLDSRIDARNALLRSTMQNCALPRDIWQLLEDEFSFTENRESLYEIFPRDFIDNCVLSGLEVIPTVPYELFAEGTRGNPDCYFSLYGKADSEIRNRDFESAEATIADLENTGFVHPYTDVIKARLLMYREEYDKALEMLDPLCEKYPEDIGIRNLRGTVYFYMENFEKAAADFDFALSKGYKGARYPYAKCLMGIGEYVKAKDMLVELWHEYPFEAAIKTAMDEACVKVNEYYEQKLSEGTLSVQETMDYAWSCMQSDDYDKAKALTDPLETDDLAEKCDLQNLRSKLYINLGENETALKHAEEWAKYVQELPEGETEEEKKRKNKLSDIYYVQASAMTNLQRFDEALEMAAKSLEAGNQRQREAHDLRRRIFHIKKDYAGALYEAEKMAEVSPGADTYYFLGVEQYEMGMLSDAFNSFGESIDYTRALECYIYRIRILCDAEQYEGAENIIAYLEENEVESDSFSYCKARVLEGKGETKEALEIYYSIIEKIENGQSDINFGEEVYYRAAELDTEKTVEERMTLVDRGLEIRDNYYALLYLKTTLFENMKKPREALEVYEKIESEYPGRYTHLSYPIAGNYYDLKDYEKAFENYSIYLKTRETAMAHDMAGLCLLYLGRADEAQEHFEKAVELDSENVRFRTNLATCHEYKFDFDTAIGIHEENAKLNDSKEEEDRRLYVNRCLARALARAGKYEEAAEAYRKNLQMFGRDTDARFVIEAYIEGAMTDKAEEYIEKYRAEDKISELQYLLMMADVRRLQGRYKDYFKLISKVDKSEGFYYSRMGRYYLHEGKYRKALELFRKSDEMEPDKLDMFNDFLDCYRMLGDKAALDACYEKALSAVESRDWDGEEQALHITKLALVHTSAGHPEKAKEYIDRAMTMPLCEHCRYGKCKDAYLALAEYYEAMGEYDKVIETCREGLEIARDEYDFVYIMQRVRKEHKKELKKENR